MLRVCVSVAGNIPNSQTALSSIEWKITGTVTAAQGFWLDNVRVESELPVDAFSAWASGYGLSGANAAATADIDGGGAGDGYANFVEYALGMDPTVSDSPYGEVVIGDPGFSIDFRRRKLDDVDVTLEWSPDMQGPWVSDGVVESVTNDDGQIEDITATVPMDIDRKFVRIRVVQ